MRTVAQKMGKKPGTRSVLIMRRPKLLLRWTCRSSSFAVGLRGEFGYIHLFVDDAEQMEREVDRPKDHLTKGV